MLVALFDEVVTRGYEGGPASSRRRTAMIGFKRKSGWTLAGSEGDSAGYGLFSAGSGSFTLKSPAGEEVEFNYKSVGGGASLGSKFNAAGSGADAFSFGTVYLSETFSGTETTS